MIQDGTGFVRTTVLSGGRGQLPGPASAIDDRLFHTAVAIGGETLAQQDIRDLELARARHALAYLKQKLGNDAMRQLLDDDLRAMMAKVRGWVEMSAGVWQSGTVTLTVPGPSASAFQD